MTYEFMTDDGRVIERIMPMSEAPRIGERRRLVEGNTVIVATRIPSVPRMQGDNWKPYISDRLPRNLEGQPTTTDGRVIVSSRDQERTICARFGYERS